MEQEQLQLQVYANQLQQISKYLETIETQKEQLEQTLDALQDIKKTKKGTNILAPISNGVFIEVQLQNQNEVIINNGSGVATKKPIEALLSDLQDELLKMSEYIVNVQKQKFQITKVVETLIRQKSKKQ